MKLIYDIVKKLRKQEIRQIRQKIKNSPFEYEKMGKLFDLVTRYDEREEEFYSQKLYGKLPDNTFRVTKSRLKRMLENIVLNDKSLTGYKSPAINARLQVQKKLLQGEILLGRGAYLASKNLLLQVISTAEKYSFHNEYFQAELLLYRNHSIRISVKEFEKKTDTLLKTNHLRASINEAMILYYSISNLLFNQAVKPEQRARIREQIDKIKAISDDSGHSQIKKRYFLSEIYFLQISNLHKEALEFCHKYLRLIQEDRSQYSEQEIAVAYGQLAQVYLRLGELDEAQNYANQALDIFSKEEMNYLTGLELPFHIAFEGGNYRDAMKYIKKAFKHPQFEASRMLASKWHYFHACILFKTGDFKEAYMKLNDTTPLLADKYGMNLSLRLLEIMIMFELQHYDLMETKILNMRQFIKRTQKNQELMRPITLTKVLIKWYKNNYDFAKTLEITRSELEKMEESVRKSSMRNDKFELIRLEEWMREKV
ncbi:MAG: tetratricopeptide repeat protein [Bacteroidetes bacterium]|nr:tetratricopeptide repeat protein [Bacteroidota bacterium]